MPLADIFFPVIPENEDWVAVYHLMNSVVQPRPIAWVASIAENGRHNLAPFSYFNICSMKPPIISISVFFNRDGGEKDTLHNIKTTRKFVVGTVTRNTAEKANITSAAFSRGVDEFDEANVAYVDQGENEPRLIAECPAQFKCELFDIVDLGRGAGIGALILGKVTQIFLAKNLEHIPWRQGLPPSAIDSVGRMGGDFYAKTTDLFELPRPVIKKPLR